MKIADAYLFPVPSQCSSPGDEVTKRATFLGVISPSCEIASSSSTSTAATQTVPAKSKQVPASFSDLLDLAIYSFGCQAGLRSHHKVRGDLVLEGVAAMLGRMLLTSDAETQAAFEEMTPTRLGN